MARVTNLRRWKNGEIFNARDYVYERDLIVSQLNLLSTLLGETVAGEGDGVNLTVNKLTANEIILNGGDLNDFIRGKALYTGDEPTDSEQGDIWFDNN